MGPGARIYHIECLNANSSVRVKFGSYLLHNEFPIHPCILVRPVQAGITLHKRSMAGIEDSLGQEMRRQYGRAGYCIQVNAGRGIANAPSKCILIHSPESVTFEWGIATAEALATSRDQSIPSCLPSLITGFLACLPVTRFHRT